ncbi:FAA hydrolase family protein [Carnobacterium sp. PL12RED10]|uniref:fumarylacetoacetate hydrolase family protein n=1 Tax=unclassified Carnobacterium TaxID=257487 RepID=UPI0006601B45|nr:MULTISPECIES: fumarylacetoacetate hydrolase family protein [unclassified Carnobacterium]KAF3302708.1 FAA hydrolase family protein [Carnobacterium sp. PL12RED10]
MKFIQYFPANSNDIQVGILSDLGIIDIREASETLGVQVPNQLKAIIEGDYNNRIQQILDYYTHHAHEVNFVDSDTIVYAPVIHNPEKIICVGLNYHDHVSESKISDDPEEPVLFSKFNNALASHHQVIPLNKHGEQFDYEGELVVVIGKTAKNISHSEALDAVFGYSIANDVSVRDLQFKSGQWLLGKTNDFSTPVGPYLTTKDEVDINNLVIKTYRNGAEVQSASTKQMIFKVAEIVSYISEYMTLQAGDIILTGTPSGVVLGYPEDQQDWLKTGDEISIEIEGLGRLTNSFEIEG